jgi:integrase
MKQLIRVVSLVLKTLLRDNFWTEKRETASRVRGRIERVLHWAKASGFRSGDNPASWDNFRDLLGGRAEKEHFPALPYADLPAFMEQLRQHEGLGHRALELLVLTAARASEAINATWDEIDFAAKVWTIPASRMKSRKPHRIPLSRSAVDLLRSLPRINGFCSLERRAASIALLCSSI